MLEDYALEFVRKSNEQEDELKKQERVNALQLQEQQFTLQRALTDVEARQKALGDLRKRLSDRGELEEREL